jgi:hypothetical protein
VIPERVSDRNNHNAQWVKEQSMLGVFKGQPGSQSGWSEVRRRMGRRWRILWAVASTRHYCEEATGGFLAEL